jgi:PAS domain S-box-containing protein
MFVVTLTVVWSITFNVGHFGDASIPLADRILAAQSLVLVGVVLAFVLAAVFADRRRSEAALKQSKERLQLQAEDLCAVSDELRTILNTAGIGITRCSRDLRYLRANETYATIAGLPVGEIIGRSIIEVMGDAAFASIRPYIERVLAGDRVEYESEIPFRCGAKSAFFRVVYVPERDSDGSVIGWIGCISDITASKQAEDRLAERNAQLALAGQAALVGSYAYQSDLETMRVSEGYCAMHGLPDQTTETTRREWRARVYPEDLAGLEEGRARTLRDHRKEYNVDYRIVREGGDVRWIESRSFVSYDDGGRPWSIVGVNIDITERKRAELTLAERNAQLALAGRAALVGSYAYDVETESVQISEGYAAIFGFPAGTANLMRSQWLARLHPEDREPAENLRNQAFRERWGEYNVEYRIVVPDRGVRWLEARTFISYDGERRPQRVVGVNIDVTERRRMEQTITDRNRQLELAGKAALVGSFAIDIDAAREDFTSHHMHFSPGFAAIYGLPEDTMEISVGDWRRLVHPDDLPKFLEHLQQSYAERRGEHHAEFRIVRPCGTIRWIETRSYIEYDQADHARRVVGVNIDITERKRADEARKLLNAELDHRVKNALATVTAVISHTRDGSRSATDFIAALEGRIRSMAATHEMLSSRGWQGISLTELVGCELEPYAARNNMEVGGPHVVLNPEAGQAMAMVLHELATNAAKYGALSNKNGRVSIRWDQRSNGRARSNLVLEWKEIGGPPVVETGKPSYGTSTIRDLIPYEFGGTVDHTLDLEGVRCRVELPAHWFSKDEPVFEARIPENHG